MHDHVSAVVDAEVDALHLGAGLSAWLYGQRAHLVRLGLPTNHGWLVVVVYVRHDTTRQAMYAMLCMLCMYAMYVCYAMSAQCNDYPTLLYLSRAHIGKVLRGLLMICGCLTTGMVVLATTQLVSIPPYKQQAVECRSDL